MNLAPQNIPVAIVLTPGNKAILYLDKAIASPGDRFVSVLQSNRSVTDLKQNEAQSAHAESTHKGVN